MNDYFEDNSLAREVYLNKYALKDEENPDKMHKRLAREFARIEQRYAKDASVEKIADLYYPTYSILSEELIFNLLKDFKYIIPAGSPMSGIGNNNVLGSLSNCFVIGNNIDSYGSICKIDEEQIQLMKRRGGVGHDLSHLRPKGSLVNNPALTSTGIVPFMERYSNSTKEVAQDGRRGALMLSLSVNHPDILDFIKAKNDISKITGANISVKFNKEFFEALKNDTDFITRFPIDNIFAEIEDGDVKIKYVYHPVFDGVLPYNELVAVGKGSYFKRLKAREIWEAFVHQSWKNAEPGILFEDNHIDYSPDSVYENFKGICCNPCQPAWALVLTPNGIRQLKDISIGDKIWSKEGWTTVINFVSSGVKDVLEYKTTAGAFYGTQEHKIVSLGKKIEVCKADTIDIIKGKDNFKIKFLPQVIMDGLVLGDGSVHKASNNLIFLYIGENDKDYFTSEIKDLIIKHRPGIKHTAYEIITNLDKENLPLVHERSIPIQYFYAKKEIVCNFLRGLYSANGSVVGERVTLKTTSAKLRDEVITLLSSVGIRSYYTTNQPKKTRFSNGDYNCRISYDVNISTDREIFYRNIGFIQNYKMSKLRNSFSTTNTKTKSHSINQTTWISNEEVFDITVDNSTHTYWSNGCDVSNCGEVWMQPYDSCRLIHVNILSFVEEPFTPNSKFNYQLFKEYCYLATKLGDDLVDLELEKIQNILNNIKRNTTYLTEIELWEKILNNAVEGRRIGIGFTGLADAMAALDFKYSSFQFLHNIFKIKMEAELEATIDMAIIRGKFPAMNFNKEFESVVNEDNTLITKGKNKFYQQLFEEFPNHVAKMKIHGRRNISWSTAAPTGSVSILTQTSSGIEPLFQPFYIRRKKIINDSEEVSFIGEDGEKYKNYYVLHSQFKNYLKINGLYSENLSTSELYDLFKNSPWYGQLAENINISDRLFIQSIVQKFTTHSISSTINLPKETTEEQISNLFLQAYELNLKGITIYREGSREGIMIKQDEKFPTKNAPKRPKQLNAEFHLISIGDKKYGIIVGLYEDKPYEVFSIAEPNTKEKFIKGTITKVKKGVYNFNSPYYEVENLQISEFLEERAVCLSVSALLRHYAPLPFVIKTIKKINYSISSFTSGLTRVMNKYVKDNTYSGLSCPKCNSKLIFENGCKICKECGYYVCD